MTKPADSDPAAGSSLEQWFREARTLQKAVDTRLAALESTVRNLAHGMTALHEALGTGHLPDAGEGGTGSAFVQEGLGPYPDYYAQAQELGVDVNDYLEQHLKWTDIAPILDRLIVPHLRPDSVVVELGPGTGRWSRRIVAHLPRGQLHLVDYSPWFVDMLTDYFKDEPRIRVHRTDGFSVPLPTPESVDVIVSFATFVMLKAGVILCYARDFYRVLKPGGVVILEYLDISTPEGWAWCENFSTPENATVFTYYTPEIMSGFFEMAGFEIVADEHVADWHPEYPYKVLIARRL